MVSENVTVVQYDRGEVSKCPACTPDLIDLPENGPRALEVMILTRPVYCNDDGSYAVYKAQLADYGAIDPDWLPDSLKKSRIESFGLVGPLGASLVRSDRYVVTGTWETGKYGQQFKSIAGAIPAFTETVAGMIAWLSRLPQIGVKRAQMALEMLGGLEGVLDALDDDPTRLLAVPGLSAERINDIKAAYDAAEVTYRSFRIWAAALGIGEDLISRSIKAWAGDAQEQVVRNPYQLSHLPGEKRPVFSRVDAIAKKLGVSNNDPRRVAAVVEQMLHRHADDGHTWSSLPDLVKSDEGLTLGGSVIVEDAVAEWSDGAVVIEQRVEMAFARYALKPLDDAERGIAKWIRIVQEQPTIPIEYKDTVWGRMVPSDEQRNALRLACTENELIISGPPGSGKTAITRAIIQALETHFPITLCAPTGKAAIRMTELTGRPATTIHRLLAHAWSGGILHGVLICDETSMTSVELLYQLLQQFDPTRTKIIFVGDVDQLPSIDAGRTLFDLISSASIPVVRLTKIFRQESDGQSKRIPEVAKAVNNGQLPELDLRGSDVNFLEYDDVANVSEAIVQAVSEWLPKKYGFKTSDIQVLSPQRGQKEKANWAIGINGLNQRLQETLNPFGVSIPIGISCTKTDCKTARCAQKDHRAVARAGDRIRHTKNDYSLRVMNGEHGFVVEVRTEAFVPDIGVITSGRTLAAEEAEKKLEGLSEKGTSVARLSVAAFDTYREKPVIHVVVDYGDRLVGYNKNELEMLQLAYASTIHGSQGSSYPAVVIPVHMSHSWSLTRSLLYTAITRAEKYVLIVGQKKAIEKAARNVRDDLRRTRLAEFLAVETASSLHGSMDDDA